jgi:four helix bundle protein
MSKNILKEKSLKFAIRIVNLNKYLCNEHKEYILSKQCLRSGTSIGANIREADFGQSKLDFIHKLSIALKEANETEYWLILLNETNFIDKTMFTSLQSECDEIIRLLVSSIKTSKASLTK